MSQVNAPSGFLNLARGQLQNLVVPVIDVDDATRIVGICLSSYIGAGERVLQGFLDALKVASSSVDEIAKGAEDTGKSKKVEVK